MDLPESVHGRQSKSRTCERGVPLSKAPVAEMASPAARRKTAPVPNETPTPVA